MSDSLISDITARLDYPQREEIARRVEVYRAEIRHSILKGLLTMGAIFLVFCFGGVFFVLVGYDLDTVADKVASIWLWYLLAYVGCMIGEICYRKEIIKKITEGCLNE